MLISDEFLSLFLLKSPGNFQVTGLLLSDELHPWDNQLMCPATPTQVSKFIVGQKKVKAVISSDWRVITLPSHKSSGGKTHEAKPGWSVGTTCLVQVS